MAWLPAGGVGGGDSHGGIFFFACRGERDGVSYLHMKERDLKRARKVSTLALRQRRKGQGRSLPDIEQTLRGSLVERYMTCGKAGCKCARGQRHGPVWYLTVSLGPGRTAGMQVPTVKLVQVRRWLENHRQVKERLEAISAINWELLRRER